MPENLTRGPPHNCGKVKSHRPPSAEDVTKMSEVCGVEFDRRRRPGVSTGADAGDLAHLRRQQQQARRRQAGAGAGQRQMSASGSSSGGTMASMV